MHRPSSLSPDNVLRYLQVTPSGANLDGILRGLRLEKSDRRPLLRILAKLKKRKLIAELPGNRFLLAGQKRKSEVGPEKQPAGRRDDRSAAGNRIEGRLILHQ